LFSGQLQGRCFFLQVFLFAKGNKNRDLPDGDNPASGFFHLFTCVDFVRSSLHNGGQD